MRSLNPVLDFLLWFARITQTHGTTGSMNISELLRMDKIARITPSPGRTDENFFRTLADTIEAGYITTNFGDDVLVITDAGWKALREIINFKDIKDKTMKQKPKPIKGNITTTSMEIWYPPNAKSWGPNDGFEVDDAGIIWPRPSSDGGYITPCGCRIESIHACVTTQRRYLKEYNEISSYCYARKWDSSDSGCGCEKKIRLLLDGKFYWIARCPIWVEEQ